jgi:filamentous hemagglutinin family protein
VTDQDFIDFFANDVVQKMALTGQKEDVEAIIEKMPSVPIANKMFRNTGTLQFKDMAPSWGLSDKTFSNGASYADLDNDGDLDLVVSNVNQPAMLYKNNARQVNKHHFLAVRLKGKDHNTMAIGSKVTVYANGQKHMKELYPSRGFQSSVDYKMVFGLGSAAKIDSVVVVWPDMTLSSINAPGIDTALLIDQAHATRRWFPTAAETEMFVERSSGFGNHEEDDHVDFYLERNIPRLLSRVGPRAAVADVNGDGLEDVYISGTLKKPGQLYIQNPTGFVFNPGLSAQLKDYEDISAVFFDADNDGDKDLMLGAGGNNRPSYAKENQNRLYINNGEGDFERRDSLPRNMGNTAVLIPMDIDDDGDLDVFSASCSMPVNYGATPENCFYINDGKGIFSLMGKDACGPLSHAGMITGAVWLGRSKELVVVGEWMPPRVFKFNNNRFSEVKTNLAAFQGWWQTVNAGDLDGDGDDDLVLGNIGSNFYLRPDAEHPVKLWINEFSNNMLPEKILTRTINGKDVPVFLKRDLTDQIPVLKKQNLRHREYASKAVQDFFPPEQMKSSEVKTFTYPYSCFAWNDGAGNYTIEKMPVPFQLSTLNAILLTDLNGDGRQDLLAGGNMTSFLPQLSRVDASYGHVMINGGNRKWTYIPETGSGIDIRGDIRDIKGIRRGNQMNYLFLRNNDIPIVYAMHGK